MGETSNQSLECTLWRMFRREINGKSEEFWVETVKGDKVETTLDYLCEYFPRDEPIAKALKLYEDEDCVLHTREYWRGILHQKMSFACYKYLENGEKELVAVSICRIKLKDSPSLLKEGMNEKKQKLFGLFQYIYDSSDIYGQFGIESCLSGSGLFTMPKYRGYNIGLEMLLARKPLCDLLGLKVSAAIFTGPASQRLAEKAGYKDLVSVTYEEVGRKFPHLNIPNIEAERIRYMYIRY